MIYVLIYLNMYFPPCVTLFFTYLINLFTCYFPVTTMQRCSDAGNLTHEFCKNIGKYKYCVNKLSTEVKWFAGTSWVLSLCF